ADFPPIGRLGAPRQAPLKVEASRRWGFGRQDLALSRYGRVFGPILWPCSQRLGALGARTETTMNWDKIEGSWKQFKGKLREQWGRLTEDDVTVIEGKRDKLVGKIQERYGITRDEADREVREWLEMLEVSQH